MWSPEQISTCPTCGELTHEFDRNFPNLAKYSRGSYFPVIAYYCPACDNVVLEAYYSKESRESFVFQHDPGWNVKSPAQLPRPHPAYDGNRISQQATLYHSRLEFQRRVRQEIGRITRADDGKAELHVPQSDKFDAETFRTHFDSLLRNSGGGSATNVSMVGSIIIVYIQVTSRIKLRVQLSRLSRRIYVPEGTKLYYFNENRPYVAPPWST